MRQPIRRNNEGKKVAKKTRVFLKKPNGKADVPHPKFGTSKLEQNFARDFLDRLGLDYVWQYEAKDIGRFYDFCVYTNAGSPVLLEIDGDYYHSNPKKIDESNLSPMQKKNKRVDEQKNNWAYTHCIPLIRIWEDDIRNHPSDVMKMLKDRFYIINENTEIKNNKNKRHVNKLNKKDNGSNDKDSA